MTHRRVALRILAAAALLIGARPLAAQAGARAGTSRPVWNPDSYRRIVAPANP